MTTLLDTAMRVCDLYDDNAQARADMRADCLGTPAHLQADLLDHFNSLLPKAIDAQYQDPD